MLSHSNDRLLDVFFFHSVYSLCIHLGFHFKHNDYDYDYEIDLFGHIIIRKYITIKCIIYKI